MAPPRPEAALSEKTQLETDTVPALWMAPPLASLAPRLSPPARVRSERVSVPPAVTRKMASASSGVVALNDEQGTPGP